MWRVRGPSVPFRARRLAPETAAAAATEAAGRVLVRSSPAGARVVIDGREVGMTPVTVRALSFWHSPGSDHAGRVRRRREARIGVGETPGAVAHRRAVARA